MNLAHAAEHTFETQSEGILHVSTQHLLPALVIIAGLILMVYLVRRRITAAESETREEE